MNFVEEFRVAMAAAGLTPPADLKTGHLTRFNVPDESGLASWYVLHLHDRFAAGAFGCWRRGHKEKWSSSNGGNLSPEERRELSRAIAEAESARRTEEEQVRHEARQKSSHLLSSASQDQSAIAAHPYLTRKQVKPYGELRLDPNNNLLLLPLRDADGSLHSLQFIAPEKRFGYAPDKRDKTFVVGSRTQACFYTISDNPSGPLVICEGYATGASIHEATGYAVVCAMFAANLAPVATALRRNFPNKTILIAADNDRFTEGNPGVSSAQLAAKAAKAIVVTPEFSDEDTRSTDFNDLAIVAGLPAVAKYFAQALPMPEIIDAATFVASPLVTPDELVVGLLHRGCKLVLGGGSKTFKTWTLLDLALSVCSHNTWLGFDTTQGRVLYINFEIQPAFFQDRIQAILKARNITLNTGHLDIWNLRGFASDYSSLIPKILDNAISKAYSLIVIDPIYKLYGELNENAANEVAKLLNALDFLAVKSNAAVAFGAHYSKGNQSSKEAIDRLSGSGVFARDPDSILNFTRHEQPDAFTIEAILRNHSPLDPFVVQWQYPIFTRSSSLNPTALKRPSGPPSKMPPDRVRELLPVPGASKPELVKLIQEDCGCTRESAYRYIRDAIFAKQISISASNSIFRA